MILHLMLLFAKDTCLPGSTMCVDNMLKICDINGYWITTDCPKNTECMLKKETMACVPIIQSNSIKDTKIMNQLMKLTKDKDFVNRLKKELMKNNDEDVTENKKDKEKFKNTNGGKEEKDTSETEENISKKKKKTKNKKDEKIQNKKKDEDLTSDKRAEKKNRKFAKKLGTKIKDDLSEENEKQDKKNFFTVRRVNFKDEKFTKTITYYASENQNIVPNTVTVTKTIKQHDSQTDVDIELFKNNDKNVMASVRKGGIQQPNKNGNPKPNSNAINNNVKFSGLVDNTGDVTQSTNYESNLMNDNPQQDDGTQEGIGSPSNGNGGQTYGNSTRESKNGDSDGAASGSIQSSGKNSSIESGGSADGGVSTQSGSSSDGGSASNPPNNTSSSLGSSNTNSFSAKQSDGDKVGNSELKTNKVSGNSDSKDTSNSSLKGNKGSNGSGGGLSGGSVKITAVQLTKAMQQAGYKPKPEFIKAIIKVVTEEFKDINMAVMFLAQCAHESGGYQYIEEIACAGSTKCAGQYGGAQGKPGKSYHGRGFIQLSWPANYKDAGQSLNMDLFSNPEKVSQDPNIGAKVSSWFWKKKVETASGVKEFKFGATTKAINGALECTGSNVDKSKNRYRIYKILAKELKVTKIAEESGCY